MPRSPKARADTVKTPIRVFVSSHQGEFRKTRKSVQARIEALEVSPLRRWLFVADLAEDYPGTSVKEDIKRLLETCSIFLLLIGRRHSKVVDDEFEYAVSNGIPVLAYEFYSKQGVSTPVKTKSLVRRLRQADIKIRGHKDKQFHDRVEMLDAIQEDLIELVGRAMNHYGVVMRSVFSPAK